MFCPKCGRENEDNAKFCSSCGEKLDNENEKFKEKVIIDAKSDDEKSEKEVSAEKKKSSHLIILILILCIIAGCGAYSIYTSRESKEENLVNSFVEDIKGNNLKDAAALMVGDGSFINEQTFSKYLDDNFPGLTGHIKSYDIEELKDAEREGQKRFKVVIKTENGDESQDYNFFFTVVKEDKDSDEYKIALGKEMVSKLEIKAPKSANVTVDGIPLTEYDQAKGLYVVNKIFNGEHEVTIKIDGCNDYSQDLLIQNNYTIANYNVDISNDMREELNTKALDVSDSLMYGVSYGEAYNAIDVNWINDQDVLNIIKRKYDALSKYITDLNNRNHYTDFKTTSADGFRMKDEVLFQKNGMLFYRAQVQGVFYFFDFDSEYDTSTTINYPVITFIYDNNKWYVYSFDFKDLNI